MSPRICHPTCLVPQLNLSAVNVHIHAEFVDEWTCQNQTQKFGQYTQIGQRFRFHNVLVRQWTVIFVDRGQIECLKCGVVHLDQFIGHNDFQLFDECGIVLGGDDEIFEKRLIARKLEIRAEMAGCHQALTQFAQF